MNVWMVRQVLRNGGSGWKLFARESKAVEYAESLAKEFNLEQVNPHVWAPNRGTRPWILAEVAARTPDLDKDR